jgi:hypothetical protein
MHIVYLTVWSNCTTLRACLLLVDKLATAWGNWSASTISGFLVRSEVALVYDVVEGAHHVSLVGVHSSLILCLTRQLVIVVSTIRRWVLLCHHSVLILTNRRFDVVVILRSVKATTGLSVLFGSWNLVLNADWLVLTHAFNILCDDVIFAHHWLLGVATLLAWQCTSLAAEAILLTTLRVVLLYISIESILVLLQVIVCFLCITHLKKRALIKTLISFGLHALVVAWLRHHLFLIDFNVWWARKVVFHALLHIIDEYCVRLCHGLLLRTLTGQIVLKAWLSVLFTSSDWAYGIVVFGV